MNKRERNKIYNKADETWTYNQQLDMLVEECSELIQVVQKIKRDGDHRPNLVKLADEIADVKIMLEQVERYWGWFYFKDLISSRMRIKMERLAERLEEAQR